MRRREHAAAHRQVALLTAVFLAFSPVAVLSVHADEKREDISEAEAEQKEEFVISSAADWEVFTEAAHTDAWSKDRVVRLDADIALSGETPRVVYFAGIFDGAGHTVDCVNIRAEVSGAGLFEQLAAGGVIRDLSVIGAVYPGGRQTTVGGIVGVNRGTVENCSWFGNVNAHTMVGGIAGKNEESGVITGCTSGGIVQGDAEAGGIAGYNLGTIRNSTNEAQINTVYTDVPFSTDDLTVTLDAILQTGRITTPDNVDQKTDIGGIAGFSVGEIADCENRGRVGYEHVGFNIGGIAGRSTGLIAGCVNAGEVYGRREAGGIVGQQQPDLTIDFSEGRLGEIGTALDDLQTMIDAALTDTDDYANDASVRLQELSKLIGVAKSDVRVLTDDATARADEAAERVNSATAALAESVSDFSTAAERISAYAQSVNAAAQAFEAALRVYMEQIEMSQADREALSRALEELGTGLSDLSRAAQELEEALDVEVPADKKSAAEAAIKDITDAYRKMFAALDDIDVILAEYEETGGTADTSALSGDIDQIRQVVAPVRKGVEGSDDAEAIYRALDGGDGQADFLDGITTGDIMELYNALKPIQGAVAVWTTSDDESDPYYTQLKKDLDAAGFDKTTEPDKSTYEALEKKIRDIKDANDEIERKLDALRVIVNESHTELLGDEIGGVQSALADLARAFREIGAASSDLTTILAGYFDQVSSADRTKVKSTERALAGELAALPDLDPLVPDAVSRLADIDLTVNSVSAAARAAGGDLYSTIDRMIAEADALNASVRGATSGTVDNLKGINTQMGYLSDLIEEAIEDEMNRSLDPADYTEDVSGENFENAVSGRTTACRNSALISADGDVGGIAGLLGIDSQLDPERDITAFADRSTSATMLEKAIVDDCENTGEVRSSGNYAGGIAGRMQMGIIYGSRSLGMVDSGGSYAGGVVGFSGATVKNCLAKTHVRAAAYVGGIAGTGDVLTDNRAMVRIKDATQAFGAIAGAVSEVGGEKIRNNLWCGGELRAIGDVDYQGLAEEADYETIADDGGGMFRMLRLTFLADGEETAEVMCRYGDDINDEDIPVVPKKEGFYGTWSRTDFHDITSEDRIEAVYTRVVTLIASVETRSGGGAIFFAEGAFRPDDVLEIADAQTADETTGASEEEPVQERFVLRLPEGQTGAHVFRFLPDARMGDVTLFEEKDGVNTLLPTDTVGAYLTFSAEGREVSLLVEKKESPLDRVRPYALPIGAGAGAALSAVIAGTALYKRGKKRRAEVWQEDTDT